MRRVLLQAEWGFTSETYDFWEYPVILDDSGRIIKKYNFLQRPFMTLWWNLTRKKWLVLSFGHSYSAVDDMAKAIDRGVV